jgi:hypothetical protein
VDRGRSPKTSETRCLAYMPYARAQEYAGIFSLQDDLDVAQKQGARDAILSIGPFLNADVTETVTKLYARTKSINFRVGYKPGASDAKCVVW